MSEVCWVGFCQGSTTTTTAATTTPPPPFDCYSHTCYEQGCLSRDITNSTGNSTGISTCKTGGGAEYCAIHISSNASYYEVTATCETTCTPSGNSESMTATWCCQTQLCNDNENKLPVPNRAPPLVGKVMALIVALASVIILRLG